MSRGMESGADWGQGPTEGTRGGGEVPLGLFTGQMGFAKDVQGQVSQQKFSPKPTLPNQEKKQDQWQNPPPSGSTSSAQL